MKTRDYILSDKAIGVFFCTPFTNLATGDKIIAKKTIFLESVDVSARVTFYTYTVALLSTARC